MNPDTKSLTPSVFLARDAMATRFELVLHGEDSIALRAAGEEALDEIARLENQLSLYRPGSEIAQLNAHAARKAVRVTPELFALLQHAQRLHAETGGAFDITIAPLVRLWGFMHNAGHMPSKADVANTLSSVGMKHLQLDPAKLTVRFDREGVMLDLGAIGKGYAVERAAELLRAAGVTSALLHGGTSTVYAIGHPPEAEHWKIAVDLGTELRRHSPVKEIPASKIGQESGAPPVALKISLRDQSLSVSAASGRQFEFNGKHFGHVMDSRTGWPAEGVLLTAVVLPSATETDALSTGLLVLGASGQDHLHKLRQNLRTWLLTEMELLVQTSDQICSMCVQPPLS